MPFLFGFFSEQSGAVPPTEVAGSYTGFLLLWSYPQAIDIDTNHHVVKGGLRGLRVYGGRR